MLHENSSLVYVKISYLYIIIKKNKVYVEMRKEKCLIEKEHLKNLLGNIDGCPLKDDMF
jgi:hypothetical protein